MSVNYRVLKVILHVLLSFLGIICFDGGVNFVSELQDVVVERGESFSWHCSVAPTNDPSYQQNGRHTLQADIPRSNTNNHALLSGRVPAKLQRVLSSNQRPSSRSSRGPSIVWYHNGSPLLNTGRTTVFDNGTLHFSRILHRRRGISDVGTYMCNVTDHIGSFVSRAAKLQVRGKDLDNNKLIVDMCMCMKYRLALERENKCGSVIILKTFYHHLKFRRICFGILRKS